MVAAPSRRRSRFGAVATAIVIALTACSGSSGDLTFDSTTTTSGQPGAAAASTAASTPPSGDPTTPAPTVSDAPVHFDTLPVGATLPTEEYCAAHVKPAREVRPENAEFNTTTGASGPPQTGYFARVNGNFTGTTDEIIQWAACKWGIDEDIARAQAAKESWWYQRSTGDYTDDPTLCVPGHGIGVDDKEDECPESIGLMQLRFQVIPNAFPMATDSSAFNVDYAMAARRHCFEGLDPWFNDVEHGRTYAAGDIWGCVGAWFSGRWYERGAVEYMETVQDYYDTKIWLSGDFVRG